MLPFCRLSKDCYLLPRESRRHHDTEQFSSDSDDQHKSRKFAEAIFVTASLRPLGKVRDVFAYDRDEYNGRRDIVKPLPKGERRIERRHDGS